MEALLEVWKNRFEEHANRHPDCKWHLVEERIREKEAVFQSLKHMEETGGEPDVIGYDWSRNQFLFADCSKESPLGRRSLCYDKQAWEERKNHKPVSDAWTLAQEMGISIMSETEYLLLQKTGEYDRKSSSWIVTPKEMREQGGALFGDARYGRVFFYHNGAQSYYASRGFRGYLWV